MDTKEQTFTEQVQKILGQVRRAVSGKDQVLLWTLVAILAKGHILLEDIPGVGKTTMAVAFSKVLGLSCNRVQFTPDVLPSDVTGYSVPDPGTGEMVYKPGAILCNVFLADELNRATSRTQSALLEAMEENQVTVDGIRHEAPRPFTVIATQNPAGAAGTQLLPDSQMDRFALRLSLGYPDAEAEKQMVLARQGKNPLEELTGIVDRETLLGLQETVENTYIKDEVVAYTVSLIGATRKHPQIRQGASPRATLSVIALAKAVAQLRGRDYVLPKDIQETFLKAVEHRLLLTAAAQNKGISCQQVLHEIIKTVPAPKVTG